MKMKVFAVAYSIIYLGRNEQIAAFVVYTYHIAILNAAISRQGIKHRKSLIKQRPTSIKPMRDFVQVIALYSRCQSGFVTSSVPSTSLHAKHALC